MASKKKEVVAEIQKIELVEVSIFVEGLTPLLMHRVSESAQKKIIGKQTQTAVQKVPLSPHAEFEESKYLITKEGRLGFPAEAFKMCTVRAGKNFGIDMTVSRQSFFILGEQSEVDGRQLVPIEGDVTPNEVMARVPPRTGGFMARYRAQVSNWKAVLRIQFNQNLISYDQLVNMLNAGGFGVGIGDWRPEKNGDYGRFKVVSG